MQLGKAAKSIEFKKHKLARLLVVGTLIPVRQDHLIDLSLQIQHPIRRIHQDLAQSFRTPIAFDRQRSLHDPFPL